MKINRYKHATVAGTFDHLHIGHERILACAYEIADRVSVGISGDELLNEKKYANSIQNYDIRYGKVKKFLQDKGYISKTYFFKLSDIYGIAKDDSSLEAIVVTEETYQNALKINMLRTRNGLNKLDIKVVNLVKDDNNEIIRSTRIRAGEIDRSGFVFIKLFQKNKLSGITDKLKREMRKPYGEIVLSEDKTTEQTAKLIIDKLATYRSPFVITVGDIITESLVTQGLKPNLAIIDGINKRHRLILSTSSVGYQKDSYFINKPGTIYKKVALEMENRLHQSSYSADINVMLIKGEEDLLALPAILFAPLGAIVLYGHIEYGVIWIEVTEEIKKSVRKIIEDFR